MLTNIPLLEAIAEERKPTFISVGMSTYKEVDQAVDIFKKAKCPFILMHCQATYPANEADLNLSCIVTLQERYGCDVGYSGHEVSPMPSIVAAALGAVAIERHITLDRTMYGSDQAASLELRGLEILVSNVKNLPKLLGDGVMRVTPEEKINADKLRYFREK
jgi:N-acetylneuraminate synthase